MENRALQERALGISNHKFNSNSIRALKAGGVRQEIHRSREVSLAKWLVQRRSNNSSHLDELLAESAAAEEGVPQQLELVETADEDEPLLLFVTPPSDSLLCTIHQGLLVDPVIAPCGHTFCRACVEAEVAISRRGSSISNASSPVVLKRTSSSRPTSGGGSGGKSTCPVDGMALDADKVIPNLAVADQLLEVPVRCKYGIKRLENGTLEADPEGCPEVVALGARRQHESACHYAPAQCPYCDASFLLRMNVAEHTRLCSHIPCPHKRRGCGFEGSQQELEAHISGCVYEGLKAFFAKYDEEKNVLLRCVREHRLENAALRETVEQLTVQIQELTAIIDAKHTHYDTAIRRLTEGMEGRLVARTGQTALRPSSQSAYIVPSPARSPLSPPGEESDVDVHSFKFKGTFIGHEGPVWALAVNAEQQMLISGSSDETIRIWDPTTFKARHTLTGHDGIVHAVVVVGRRLISGSSDKTIRVGPSRPPFPPGISAAEKAVCLLRWLDNLSGVEPEDDEARANDHRPWEHHLQACG